MANDNKSIPSDLNVSIARTINALATTPRTLRLRMCEVAYNITTAAQLGDFLEEFALDAPGDDPDRQTKHALKGTLTQKVEFHATHGTGRLAPNAKTAESLYSMQENSQPFIHAPVENTDTRQQLLNALAGLACIDIRQVSLTNETNRFLLPNGRNVREGLISLKLRGFVAYDRPASENDPITLQVNDTNAVIRSYMPGQRRHCRM